MNEQQLIGSMVALLGGVGWYHSSWLLEQTSKGRRLVGWFGPTWGVWVLRGLLACVVVFGILLAADVVGPRVG
ncbi:MAG: hypothetical protein VB861_07950 [Planctomycetaceae bacterium]|jgi:hypothetical protein